MNKDDLKIDSIDDNNNGVLIETIETNNRSHTFKKLKINTKYLCITEIGTNVCKGNCVSVLFETICGWSQPCCNKFHLIDECEIAYNDIKQIPVSHKMYFGKKMVGKGIFEIEILIVDAGQGGRSGFIFGIAVEENQYFGCGKKCGWCAFGNHSGYGCGLSSSGRISVAQGANFGGELTANDKVICRLDLDHNTVSFKVNNSNVISPQFNGFSDKNKHNGFYFAYSTTRHNSRIRVLRCIKIV